MAKGIRDVGNYNWSHENREWVKASGTVDLFNGMVNPKHDKQTIDESDSSNVVITYFLNNVVVGTKNIVTSGTDTTITMALP